MFPSPVNPSPVMELVSPALAGGYFFITEPPGKPYGKVFKRERDCMLMASGYTYIQELNQLI